MAKTHDMASSKLHHQYLSTIFNAFGSLDRSHTERLGQAHGCPCYLLFRFILSLIFPQMPNISDGFNTGMFLNSEDPLFWRDAGLSLPCHDLSLTSHSIDQFLQENHHNRENDASHSVCTSNPMNSGTFETEPLLVSDSTSFSDFGLHTCMDNTIPLQMPEELAFPWTSPDETSLFGEDSNWDQLYRGNEGTYKSPDEYPTPNFDNHAQNFSSPHLPEFTAHSSYATTHSEDHSPPPGNAHSSLMNDSKGFICRWTADAHCDSPLGPEKSEVAKHLQFAHDVKPGGDKVLMHCMWDGCGKQMKKESISRHIVAVHLSKKTECDGCGKKFARWDSKLRHERNSKRECSSDSEYEPHDRSAKRPRLSSDSSL